MHIPDTDAFSAHVKVLFMFSTPTERYFKKRTYFKTCHSMSAHLISGGSGISNHLTSKCLVNNLLVHSWQLFKTCSRQVKEAVRSAFSDSAVTPQDIPTGSAGFPGGGLEGPGAPGRAQAGSSVWGRRRPGRCGRTGAAFWPFLSGLLSPSPTLRNMFWKLYPEGTRPFGDSLFLDPWTLMTFRGVFHGPSSD